MISRIFRCFPKTKLLICLKKSFLKPFCGSFLYLIFISMYGFNHAFWLNWILCTSFSFKPWFSACFKALLWITYFSIQQNLFFHLFFFGVEMLNLWLLNNAFGYSTSTSRKYPVLLFSSYFFYEVFIKFWKIFSPTQNPFRVIFETSSSIQIICL